MMRQTFCAQISAGSSIPRFHRMNETSCKGLQNEQRCPVWHHLGTASGLEAEYRASLFFDLGSLFFNLTSFFRPWITFF